MNSFVVLTYLADDEPGLVELLSQIVVTHKGNWLESRMSRLAGKFAGIARIQVPQGKLRALTEDLEELQAQGFTIVVERLPEALEPEKGLQRLCLNIIGQDRPGILHEISQSLARHQVSVTELRSDITSAPMTGEPLFEATADAQVPNEVDLEELEAELDAIADELNVDISLEFQA